MVLVHRRFQRCCLSQIGFLFSVQLAILGFAHKVKRVVTAYRFTGDLPVGFVAYRSVKTWAPFLVLGIGDAGGSLTPDAGCNFGRTFRHASKCAWFYLVIQLSV